MSGVHEDFDVLRHNGASAALGRLNTLTLWATNVYDLDELEGCIAQAVIGS